jgi:hypothetical protein
MRVRGGERWRPLPPTVSEPKPTTPGIAGNAERTGLAASGLIWGVEGGRGVESAELQFVLRQAISGNMVVNDLLLRYLISGKQSGVT